MTRCIICGDHYAGAKYCAQCESHIDGAREDERKKTLADVRREIEAELRWVARSKAKLACEHLLARLTSSSSAARPPRRRRRTMPGEPRSNQESFDAGYRQGANDERKAIVAIMRRQIMHLSADQITTAEAVRRSLLIQTIEARGAQPPSEAKEE